MTTATTAGIEVSVSPTYMDDYSNPQLNVFVFKYKISIENKGLEEVKLVSRKWLVTESTGEKRIVVGEGVVGKQPVLNVGDKFEYESVCELSSPIGKMMGYYTMQKTNDQEKVNVTIPEFDLTSPQKLN